jgi:nucleoside-diphosphate-sugar epimerase
MRICVTGATGFIGSHLTELLVRNGNAVKILARPSSDLSVLRGLDVEVVRGDVADAAAVEKAITGCQHVYHLAAGTTRAQLSRQQNYAINVEGASHVVLAAKKAGVERLVYGSSCGVYGTIRLPPVNENTEVRPNTYYRASKLMAEQIVRAAFIESRLPVVVARIPSVIGPRAKNWLELVRVIATGQFRLLGCGENRKHLGYVSDVVQGLQRCGTVPGIEGQSYILAGNEPVTFTQFVNLIAQELGVELLHGYMMPGPFRTFHTLAEKIFLTFGVEIRLAHRYEFFFTDEVFQITKARKELGYEPTVSVRDGVRQMVQWYREHGDLPTRQP